MPATKYGIIYTYTPGGVAEWLKAPVSKTGIRVYTRIEGSNPSPSATRKYLYFYYETGGAIYSLLGRNRTYITGSASPRSIR